MTSAIKCRRGKKDLHAVQVTMSTVVNALSAGGDWELAMQTFDELRDYGVQPNAICYNAAIAALSRGRQADAAKALAQEMQLDGYSPDLYTYSTLIAALGRAGRQEEALQVRHSLLPPPCSGLQDAVLQVHVSVGAILGPQVRGHAPTGGGTNGGPRRT